MSTADAERPTRRTSDNIQHWLQFVQLVLLVIGVAGVFLSIGRKDQILMLHDKQIEELRLISTDLVKVTTRQSLTTESNASDILRLEARLERLERATSY